MSPQHGKHVRAFTLLEVIICLTLLGVLAAAGVAKWSKFHKITQLDGEAHDIFLQLENARGKALKQNTVYLVKLDPAAGAVDIAVDSNNNGMVDPKEVERHMVLQKVKFGFPSAGPTLDPDGKALSPTSISGAWLTGIIFKNDRAGTVNNGALYLNMPGLDSRVVCMRKPNGSRQLELWRWDGSNWLKK